MSYTANHVNATVEFEKFESAITETVEKTPYTIENATYKEQPQQTATVGFSDTTNATETKETDADFTFSSEVVAYKVKLTITNNSNFNINVYTTAQEPDEQDNWFVKIAADAGCDSLATDASANVFVYVGIKDLSKNVNPTSLNIQTALEKVSFVELSYKVNNQIVETQQVQKNTSATLLNAYYKDFATDLSYSGASDQYNYSTQNPLQRANNTQKQGVGAWLDAQGNIVDKDTVITQNTTLEPDWYFYDNSTSAWTMYSNTITPTENTREKAKIIIPNKVNGADVTSIGVSAFDSCELTEITIPSGVISIGEGAFYRCYELTQITIPSGVISIEEGAFSDCEALKTVTFEAGSLLDSISSELFYNCYELTQISIPSSVTIIGDSAFSSCLELTQITMPSGVTSIGNEVFNECYSLTQITIPSGVASIGNEVFNGCVALQSINVEEGNQKYYSDGQGLFEKTTEDVTTLITYANASGTTYTIPSSVTSIGEFAFYKCYSLTQISIPSGVTSIGDSAFDSCSALKTVTFEAGSQLQSIGDSAFRGCRALTQITIPSSVTSIGDDAFASCIALTQITIPSGVTSIGDSAFFVCSALTQISIPSSVTSIGSVAFSYCSALKTVTFEENSKIASIGTYAFRDSGKTNAAGGVLTLNFIGIITQANAPTIQSTTFSGITKANVRVTFTNSATYNKFTSTTNWNTYTTLVSP